MIMRVNQELCTGCGTCVTACSNAAIYLVDHRAVIEEALCTQCQACLDACPNGAITTIAEPVRPVPIVVRPVAERGMIPAPSARPLPESAAPARSLAPLAGAALAFLSSEVAPRLIDVFIAALERRLAQPTKTTLASAATFSPGTAQGNRCQRKQARFRGGHAGKRNRRGRR